MRAATINTTSMLPQPVKQEVEQRVLFGVAEFSLRPVSNNEHDATETGKRNGNLSYRVKELLVHEHPIMLRKKRASAMGSIADILA